jgi:hypothetical protein
VTKSTWAALVLVAAPLVALFGPALVSDRSFAMRDAAHFYYPLFKWCCAEWAAGRVPLWNPYENCGVPVLADASSSVFYPGKLLFVLPIDFALRYKLYIVLHVALAAGGSYLLARRMSATPHAAALAAVAYAYGGNVVFLYSNVVFLVGAAWLPVGALAALDVVERGSWRAAVGLGVVLSLMTLGGDPQAAYHLLLVNGLYWLVTVFGRKRDDAMPRQWQAIGRQLGQFAMAAVIGFALSAVQVLPSAEATRLSERDAFNRPRTIYEAVEVARELGESKQPHEETRGQSIVRGLFGPPEAGLHHELAYDFSVGPWRLAELIWPNVGGRMFPFNRRWMSLIPGESRTWTPTLYMGLLPLLLATSAWSVRSSDARCRWLSWMALLFALASLGEYGLGWLIHELAAASAIGNTGADIGHPVGGLYWLLVTVLPGYVYFRYPAKLFVVAALAISQLASVGLDQVMAQPSTRLAKVCFSLTGLSLAAASVLWFIGPRMFGAEIKADNLLGPFDAIGAQRDILQSLFHTAVVALAGAWLVRQAIAGQTRSSHAALAICLLTAVEIVVANGWTIATAPIDVFRSSSPIAGELQDSNMARSDSATPRVYRGSLATWRPPSFKAMKSKRRLEEVARWEHDTLFPKYAVLDGVSLVESYGSIKLLDYESLLYVAKQHGPPQADRLTLPQPTALRMLGTEYLVLPQRQRPEFAERVLLKAADGPESASLWRMKRVQPRVWIVNSVEWLPPLGRRPRVETVDHRTKEVLFPGGVARRFETSAAVESDAELQSWQPHPAAAADRPIEADSTCRITHYDPRRVVIEAELSESGLLVLSDTWFPGWRAWVSTQAGEVRQVPILRTNRVLRGVWLSAGAQSVEFRYEPDSFYCGLLISGASWIAVVGIACYRLLWRLKRRV